jgi:pimeloyl-ACP methyl ester carboxylesterase
MTARSVIRRMAALLPFLLPACAMTAPTITLHSRSFSRNTDSNNPCSVVLIHGLDSSSQTWSRLAEEDLDAVALDLRGAGQSEMGLLDDFSQQALVQDIHCTLQGMKNKDQCALKFVLVGHSLGGRIAMAYANTFPEQIQALVIEDMDIAQRSPKNGPFSTFSPLGDRPFERKFASAAKAKEALLKAGYPEGAIDRWMQEGRIRQNEKGDWWTDVNPDFRNLCYQHVLNTHKGEQDWKTMGGSFPCHVLVAGSEGTVCSEESITEMQTIMGDRMRLHRFPQASHSIHNTATKEYMDLLSHIITVADT